MDTHEDDLMAKTLDKKRIVIADDDDLLMQLVKHTFGQHSIDAEIATNGEHALELVRTLRPDAVILDGMMPG
ncbi:MAG: response regulator, partial [Planctomycetes bacterium]|nr:response regulator [Planctomycetota bacterium]